MPPTGAILFLSSLTHFRNLNKPSLCGNCMSLFTEWNSILLEEYFSPANAGQDVWISTNRLELEGIGVHLGGVSGLIEAVKQGPAWIYGNDNIAIKANMLVSQRAWPSKRPTGYNDPGNKLEIYKDKKSPTYLPYIALWVLARSEVEKGFYARVSELISEPFPNNLGNKMGEVWTDLARWSTRQEGEFGYFRVNVLGQNRFVGMAYAQIMVTHKDMDGISRLFGSCRLHSGQILDDNHFDQLLEHGQNSHYLSTGLKDAMGSKDYRLHLKQLLSTHLEFWDGRVPKHTTPSSDVQDELLDVQQEDRGELSIILKLNNNDDTPCWDIGWRLPVTVTGHNYAIKVNNDEEVKARLELVGTHLHCIPSTSQENARSALNQSALEEVTSMLSYTESDGERKERNIYLRRDKIRVLIWDSPDASLNDSLLEREFPIRGTAFLLYSSIKYSNLESLLKNENISYTKVVEVGGLPEQWGLICIENTENLTPEQRAVIVDEEISAPTKARIRLVGGKPILGSGSKKYAYYDLPIIELEAPTGVELIASGLTFEELDKNQNLSIKRFKFTQNQGSGYVFKIKATLGGEVLCTAGLQVLAAGGLATTQRSHFSVDKYGRILADGSGLLGAIIGEVPTSDLDISSFQVDAVTLANEAVINVFECMESNVSSLFMDSVATADKGSMSYGVARDQIRRLASNIGMDDIEPAFLIRELRRRGHVEVETNVTGHMVRVCSVPPSLYSLPITNSEQRQLYGVCGSLRLQQWKELEEVSDCRVFIDKTTSNKLPAIRISSDGFLGITEIAQLCNFQVVDLPAQKLSQWLGSIQETIENLAWYPEHGFCPNYLERLNPGRGVFNETENILVDKSRKFELFKYEDPKIQGMRVYKLGENLGDGVSKYSFIHDSRWGVWIAIRAFAEFIKNPPYSILDASPWPIPYDKVTGCLWLPARMEPPFVIERALTLSAGDGPIVMQITSKMDGESILLFDTNQRVIGKVSCVFSEMANGKWLCYRWVPEVVARNIASLLGGELREMRCNTISRRIEDKKCQFV